MCFRDFVHIGKYPNTEGKPIFLPERDLNKEDFDKIKYERSDRSYYVLKFSVKPGFARRDGNYVLSNLQEVHDYVIYLMDFNLFVFYGESVILEIYEKGECTNCIDLHSYISIKIRELGKLKCDKSGVKNFNKQELKIILEKAPYIVIDFITSYFPELSENLIKQGEIADIYFRNSIVKVRYGVESFSRDGGYGGIPYIPIKYHK